MTKSCQMDSAPRDLTESDSDSDETYAIGKENIAGRAIFKDSEMLCPVSTTSALAIAEQPELRAYKLGKQKCSYNQVELVVKDLTGGKMTELKVSEAIETLVGPEVDEKLRESCLKFNVRFVNDNRMNLYLYVVYATPRETQQSDKHTTKYQWIPVTRSKCRKGCKGPIIRGLQRFGRMPRRGAGLEGEDSWKEPRHLYIAIDEASTHVCPRHETSKFRLLVAAYDRNNQIIGTTISSSIRVLANNDAPLGAASFKLHCHISGGWVADVADSQSRELNTVGPRAGDRVTVTRSPLHDILRNTRLPKAYRSIPLAPDDTKNSFETRKLPLRSVTEDGVNPCQLAIKGVESGFTRAGTTGRIEGGEGFVLPKLDTDNSLTDLCHRLFKTCALKRNHGIGQSTVTLRGLASALGARRRLIMEILSVLESVQVVRQQSKERYRWHGIQKMEESLVKLKEGVRSSLPLSRVSASKRTYRGQRGAVEENSPMATLSKHFVQLFLVREKAAIPMPWDQILESIVNGRGHDPETARAKTRRLGEIARIFSALNLVKKTVNERLQSGLFYEWLGPEGVQHYLSTIHVDAKNCLGMDESKSTTKFVVGIAGAGDSEPQQGKTRMTEIQTHRQMIVAEQISLDLDTRIALSTRACDRQRDMRSSPAQKSFTFSKKQRRKLKRKRQQTNQPLGLRAQSPSQLCLGREEIPLDFNDDAQTEPQQAQDSSSSGGLKTTEDTISNKGSLISECSEKSCPGLFLSQVEGKGEDFTTTEQLEPQGVTSSLSHGSYRKTEDQLSVIVTEIPVEPYNQDQSGLEYPPECQERGHDTADCHITGTTHEKEAEMDHVSTQVEQSASPCNHSPLFTYNSSYDFPYKKRKLSTAPFGKVGKLASAVGNPSRDTEALPSGLNEASKEKEDLLQPAFDPLSKLLIVCSPQQIFEFQLRNPDFLTNYVMIAREMHHRQSAQRAREQGLIRPEPRVGKVQIRTINSAFSTISASVPGRCR